MAPKNFVSEIARVEKRTKPALLNSAAARPAMGDRTANSPSAFQKGDPNLEKAARRGRREIDATFDLHGHTQATARNALLGFLAEARLRGYRCVLVITGKGPPSAAQAHGAPRQRGVLRDRMFDWMRDPDFRVHISRAAQAHQRHGGRGAFYLFLKK